MGDFFKRTCIDFAPKKSGFLARKIKHAQYLKNLLLENL